jgi:hypothetical protein
MKGADRSRFLPCNFGSTGTSAAAPGAQVMGTLVHLGLAGQDLKLRLPGTL